MAAVAGRGATIRVEGIAEIKRVLDGVEEAVRKEGALLMLMRAGRVLRDLARVKAPKRKGKLAKSIGVRRGRRSETVSRVIVSARVPYAHLVEYGAAPHTLRARNKGVLVALGKFLGAELEHPGASPKPFLRPALDEGAQAALAEAARTIDEQIERAAAKLARQAARRAVRAAARRAA